MFEIILMLEIGFITSTRNSNPEKVALFDLGLFAEKTMKFDITEISDAEGAAEFVLLACTGFFNLPVVYCVSWQLRQSKQVVLQKKSKDFLYRPDGSNKVSFPFLWNWYKEAEQIQAASDF